MLAMDLNGKTKGVASSIKDIKKAQAERQGCLLNISLLNALNEEYDGVIPQSQDIATV